jgi:hypothetical protein
VWQSFGGKGANNAIFFVPKYSGMFRGLTAGTYQFCWRWPTAPVCLARQFLQLLEIFDDSEVLLKFIEALADLLDPFLIQVSQELSGGS